jgi:hypothetical protein
MWQSRIILKIFIFNVKLKIFSKVSIYRADTKNMHFGHFKILTVLKKILKLKDQTKPNDFFFASDKKWITNLLKYWI